MYPQDIEQAVYVFEIEAILLGREHNTIDQLDCWCDPFIERYENGDLVIHKDWDDRGH